MPLLQGGATTPLLASLPAVCLGFMEDGSSTQPNAVVVVETEAQPAPHPSAPAAGPAAALRLEGEEEEGGSYI